MPSNTVPEPDDLTPDEIAILARLDEHNGSRCDFEWCAVDHFDVGWEDDTDGNPVRRHEFDLPGEFSSVAPFLTLEETRSRVGIEYRGPAIAFPDSAKEFTIDEGTRAIQEMVKAVAKWREIAAQVDEAGQL